MDYHFLYDQNLAVIPCLTNKKHRQSVNKTKDSLTNTSDKDYLSFQLMLRIITENKLNA